MVRGATAPTSARSGLAPGAVLAALPHAVLVVGGDDNVVYANQAAEDFLQTSLPVLLGNNLQDLIPHDSPMFSLIYKVRKTRSSMSHYGVRVATPRIGERVVTIDAAPLPEDPHLVVLSIQEGSIAGKIDRALTHRGAARTVTAMAVVLAHEIKNPLSGVRGAAQLLEQNISPEDRELTRLIVDEADRVCGIIDRMEMFADDPKIERMPVNIHEVLDRVVRLARNGFGRNVRFLERYDPSLPPAYGNRDQLIQVFLNLVKNACEAVSADDGEVVVATAFQHGFRMAQTPSGAPLHLPLVVTVQDNGGGVAEDLRDHLFEPFVSTKSGGTGLGLALVAKLVGDHGGVIDVRSRPRHTVFRVMLPMLKEETMR